MTRITSTYAEVISPYRPFGHSRVSTLFADILCKQPIINERRVSTLFADVLCKTDNIGITLQATEVFVDILYRPTE